MPVNMRIHTAAALAAAAVLCSPAATARQNSTAGVHPAEFDTAVRPQDDLFRYVNGRWLATTEIPAEKVNYDTFVEIGDKVEADLRTIIEEVASAPNRRTGSPAQQIGDLYASLMDEARIEALGTEPIRPQLEQISAIVNSAAFAAEAGKLAAQGVGGPFGGTVAVDPESGELVVHLSQSGILLPDREYYLTDTPRYVQIRQLYLEYLTGIFTLAGRANASSDAAAVIALETELARAQWGQAESRDPLKTSNRFPFADLNRQFPGFDWRRWAEPQGIHHLRLIVLAQPSFFKRFAELAATAPLEAWKAWLAARYITASAPFISTAFADARFEFFGRVLSGQELPRVRWRRGVSLVSGYLGDALGRLYIQKHFSPAAKQRVEDLIDHLLQAFRQAIDESAWMAAATKRKAKQKLAALSVKVGYPDEWREYKGLVIKPDDLLGNIQRARQFENDVRLARTRSATRRSDWLITPQTPNAYYGSGQNELIVTAALLQPPLFDARADDAANYGAIGAIVGHELGHAFDDRGRFYDGRGEARDWWTPGDEAGFKERARALAEQFDRFTPLPGAKVSGELTLAENMGDLAGLAIAHRAYTISRRGRPAPVIEGLTGDQRFFVAWARVWRGKLRDEYMRQWVLFSPHAPPEYRANGPVSNMEAFYEAFELKPGDRLFREPGRRVRVW
jgi:predicted metalloendopeptidase